MFASIQVVAVATLGSGVRAQLPTPLSTSTVARRAIPATVTILSLARNGDTLALGSGFLLKANGVIATNWHVMRGASRAMVILATGERYDRVSFLDGDSLADVVLLKVPGFDLPTVTAISAVPPVGERVVVIGSPLGLARTVTEGIVSATRMVRGRQLVQVTAALSPGSSGGPVIDVTGRVFAVATSTIAEGQQLNFAVPVRYALALLRDSMPELRISAVFAETTSTESPRDSLGIPSRTSNPRQNLYGVYTLAQRWIPPSLRTFHAKGLLLVSHRDIGWFAVGGMSDTAGTPGDSTWRSGLNVKSVCGFTSNAIGNVLLDFCSDSYDGYQTVDGLFFFKWLTFEGTKSLILMDASPVQLPLSDLTGLYDLEVRTHYLKGKERIGDPVDWHGEAAALVARDTVHLDVYLENEAGGDIGARFEGPIMPDGSFRLSTSDSTKSYAGTLRPGRIYGAWTDVRNAREKRRFEGTLIGRRK